MDIVGTRQKYLNPFRPHFEKHAGIAWLVAAILIVLQMFLPGAARRILFGLAVVCIVLAVPWLRRWLTLMAIRDRMDHREITVMPISAARKEFDPDDQRIWLGWGFPWTTDEAQLAREVALTDATKLTQAESPEAPGQSWMHGVHPAEEKIYLPVVDEHTLIIAMTRWGKTVLFRLLITQAIKRGEAVFVFDPKGDKDLKSAFDQACRDMGKEPLAFHPGFPATSVRMDPLKNYIDSSELASRISGLLGRGARDATFTAFAHMQLVNVINGMVLAGKRPTLVAIKRYLDGHLEALLVEAITAYCDRVLAAGWQRNLDGYRRAVVARRKRKPDESDGPLLLTTDEEAVALTAFYHDQVAASSGSPELEGLIATVAHPAEHRSKMLTSLMPLLTKLTSGPLARLMSTDVTDPGDQRMITDTARIIEQRLPVYIGLNAMQNEDVANAIGEILLADVTATCGTRYNYAKDKKITSVFIDEAPEILNAELIKLLNKGGGAGFRLTMATQTYSDIVARLGDAAMAEKVMGNIANLIFGRVTAAESQKYFADRLPRVAIKTLDHSRNISNPTLDPAEFTVTRGESLRTAMEAPIEPQTLGCLPKMQFFALLGSRFVKGRLPVLVADKTC